MTEIDTYQKGNFKLEEWEDVNYCEHDFYKNDEGLTDKEIVDLLNEQDERIRELENKLNQTALEFLNHEIISMGKAVEISEMSYHDFIKYRAEHGNPMELQL